MRADQWQAIANVGNTLSGDLLIADLRAAEAEVARLREQVEKAKTTVCEELADYRAYYDIHHDGDMSYAYEATREIEDRIEARRSEEVPRGDA